MRISRASRTALLLGGLALAGAALPAAANAGQVLSNGELDRVTAGFLFVQSDGIAQVFGLQSAQTQVILNSEAQGDGNSGSVSGSAVASAIGFGPGAAANADTAVVSNAPNFTAQTLKINIGQPGSPFAGSMSMTVGFGFVLPALTMPAMPAP